VPRRFAKALTGATRAEHLFALEQALALYTAYREKASACDVRIEARVEGTEHPNRGRDHGGSSIRRGVGTGLIR